MSLPAEIRTPRLRLVQSTSGEPWGPRRIERLLDGLDCGSIEFFTPPTETAGCAEAEVRIDLAPAASGHGVATEALTGMLSHTDALEVRVRGAVAPENARALRVLAKCGFTQLRGSDVEGQLLMVRPLP